MDGVEFLPAFALCGTGSADTPHAYLLAAFRAVLDEGAVAVRARAFNHSVLERVWRVGDEPFDAVAAQADLFGVADRRKLSPGNH